MIWRTYSLFLLGLLSFPLSGWATTYNVSPTGSDSNNGTASQPFLTIARASSVMVPGDMCLIHAGVYRETLHPANSGTLGKPITYQAAGDGTVTVDAADLVTGWTNYQGTIWQATTAVNRGARENQVFVDGHEMVEARWPHLTWNATTQSFDFLNSLSLAVANIDSGSNTMSITGLNQPNNFWVGATVWGVIGARWTAESATVTASTAGSITITGKSSPWFPDQAPWEGELGGVYLTGILGALGSPGEWFLQNGTLYLMTVTSDNPSGHLVEIRNGRLAIDLTSRNYITVNGLTFFAGTANLTGTNNTIQFCSFLNNTHEPTAMQYGSNGGLYLAGSNNLIEDCLVDGSSSNGINLAGTNDTVSNCLIQNVDYAVDYSSAIEINGTNCAVINCTMLRAGRALMRTDGTASTISYNDFSQACELSQDCGATYCYDTNGGGTVLDHNWVHDVDPWALTPITSLYVGIYIDDGCSNFVIHHNVMWNCDYGLALGHINPSMNESVYNNDLSSNRVAGMLTFGSSSFTNIVVWNNLSDRNDFSGTDVENNLTTTSPGFVNAPIDNFYLNSTSPAIDYGKVIPGITDGYVGAAPDAGAYEYGGVNWTPGVSGQVGASAIPAVAPTFSPAHGTYATPQSITLSDAASGALIYYTLDGTTPTTSSTRYVQPFILTGTETVNAIAVVAGLVNSSVSSAAYAINASGPNVLDSGFEASTQLTGAYAYDPTGSAWTFTSNAGLQDNGSALGAPAAPNGTQTAFLQGINGVNGAISQTINFTSTGTYSVWFQAALRGGFSTQSFNLTLDGTVIGSFTPSSTNFSTFQTNPIAITTTGNHILSFVGTSASGNATDFIDSVSVLNETPAQPPSTDTPTLPQWGLITLTLLLLLAGVTPQKHPRKISALQH